MPTIAPCSANSMKTKRFVHTHPCAVKLSFLALLFVIKGALAQTVWTGATGDWFTNANWSAGVPDSSTEAQINNAGTSQINISGATSSGVTLGLGSSDSGNLSVDGSGTLDTNGMEIASSGGGNLSITNGAVVSSSRFVIGDDSGSNGMATVSGIGSMWNNFVFFDVGFSGTATLNISSGGQVFSNFSQASIGESTGSVGMVTVDGAGSSWTPAEGVYVGDSGSGTLTITHGGTVSSIFSGNGVIGNNPGSSGSVSVSGAGSNWTNGNALVVGGNGGTGILHISSGGAVSSSYGIVGEIDGATGTVTIDGTGSSWTNSGGDLFIGSDGGVGMLTITNGGQLSDANGNIGSVGASFFPDSTGTVSVDGAGSTWTNSGNLNIGGAGTGTLDVRNGATVAAVNTVVNSGGTLKGTGTVNGPVNNGGTVSPGDALGTLTVKSYTQATFGTLLIDIAGTGAGQYSVLNVPGKASLGGLLNPVLQNGFVPTIGQEFKFLNYGSQSGTLVMNDRNIDGVAEHWHVIYQPASAILSAEAGNVPVNFTFTFTPIDFPGAAQSVAGGVNNSGQIVGGYQLGDGSRHGFLVSGGTFTAIDNPNAASGTECIGINNLGQIVGAYNLNPPETGHLFEGQHGFLFDGGTFSTIDFPAGAVTSTTSNRINDSSVVVGLYRTNGPGNGFEDAGGTFTSVNVPGGVGTQCSGNNNAGQIVGQFKNTLSGPHHGFLDNGGVFTAINFPGANDTVAADINSSADVVGTYRMSNGVANGFLSKRGSFTSIAFPGAIATEVTGINDQDELVGIYEDLNQMIHGFLATPISTGSCSTSVAIAQNFNPTAIPGYSSIWFNSNFAVGGGKPVDGTTVQLMGGNVSFTANGVSYDVPVPDSVITFSASASCSTISFDATHQVWNVTVPLKGSDEIFLSGAAFPVPYSGLPGGMKNVSWSGHAFAQQHTGTNISVEVGRCSLQFI